MSNNIKTRFAPSPTGFLHVGGLRTALFNYLFTRKNEGVFVLRIEDTDKSREVAEAAEEIQKTLREFGLDWDEGPVFQSQRLDIYQKYADELVSRGGAYTDTSTSPPSPSPPARPAGGRLRRGVPIRQKIPKGQTVEFEDLVYGKIRIETDKLDEGVLIKSDGYPTYNLANVIDDHEMGITHVIRGEEFIPSTPKHILLYQALGWEPPQFIHLPLILDKNRQKLSKRTGDVAVEEYLKKGYLKEALLNFIAFLGWNPKTTDEIFSVNDLIKEFDVKKINKAGAIFDIDKLDFINREWQKRLNLGENDPLYQRAKKMLEARFSNLSHNPSPDLGREIPLSRPGEGEGEGSKLFKSVWSLILERIKGPSDLEYKLPEFYFFFEEPRYEAEMLIWKDTGKKKIRSNLESLKEFFSTSPLFPPLSRGGRKVSTPSPGEERGEERSKAELETATKQFLTEHNVQTGETLWPLRVALSGQKNSPGPFEIITTFANLPNGKQIILSRIQKAIEKLT